MVVYGSFFVWFWWCGGFFLCGVVCCWFVVRGFGGVFVLCGVFLLCVFVCGVWFFFFL